MGFKKKFFTRSQLIGVDLRDGSEYRNCKTFDDIANAIPYQFWRFSIKVSESSYVKLTKLIPGFLKYLIAYQKEIMDSSTDIENHSNCLGKKNEYTVQYTTMKKTVTKKKTTVITMTDEVKSLKARRQVLVQLLSGAITPESIRIQITRCEDQIRRLEQENRRLRRQISELRSKEKS